MQNGDENLAGKLPALRDDLIKGTTAAAAYCGLDPRTIYHLVEIGELPAVKKGKTLFFTKSSLDAAFRSAA